MERMKQVMDSTRRIVPRKLILTRGLDLCLVGDDKPMLGRRGLERLCGGLVSGTWASGTAGPQPRGYDTAGDDPAPGVVVTGEIEIEFYEVPFCERAMRRAWERTGHQACPPLDLLGEGGLSEFLLVQLGTGPSSAGLSAWSRFHERITLLSNYVPPCHFTLPKEVADLAVALLRRGLVAEGRPSDVAGLDGRWASHWHADDLDRRYGARKVYLNAYPGYLPLSGRGVDRAYCYPVEALEDFRAWLTVQSGPRLLPGPTPGRVWDGSMYPISVAQLDESLQSRSS